MSSQRQARRERNREDFLRATQQAVKESHPKHFNEFGAGQHAGNTFREHLEDEIRKAVRVHERLVAECQKLANEPGNFQNPPSWTQQGVEHKRKAARGVIRGLCKALLIYEDSYNMDSRAALMKIEKEFMNG